MEIRQATKEDVQDLMKLQYQLFLKWDEMDEMDHMNKKWFSGTEHEQFLSKFIKDKDYRIFIAVEGDSILGYLKCKILEREPFLEKAGCIEETYVTDNARGKGIGSKLFETALEWFKESGLKHASVSTHALDDEANKFWKKKGFEEFNLVYKMKLR